MSLTAQLQAQIRAAIRDGRAAPGSRLPSSRTLAEDLGVSRPLVGEAYAQLAAEGYLQIRQGARPLVCDRPLPRSCANEQSIVSDAVPRFDLRPAVPDLAHFPRREWQRALRTALNEMTADEFGYGSPHGVESLRRALADYLGRVRGIVCTPEQVIVTSGFTEARALFCEALAKVGREKVAVEDPGYTNWEALDAAGLCRLPIGVDNDGLIVDELERSDAQAVLLTPAHQFPTGASLSPKRRAHLVAWLKATGSFALEDDYDSEFRYDGSPTGAVQGLVPEQVVYAGTVSKTLAPGLRLGWVVVPPGLDVILRSIQKRWSEGSGRIEQHALVQLIESGDYDRHLRRMRKIYRARRDLMVSLLAEHCPQVQVAGVAAGLHVTVRLPMGAVEEDICRTLDIRGVAVGAMARHRINPSAGGVLLLGYGCASEASIRTGIQVFSQAFAASLR